MNNGFGLKWKRNTRTMSSSSSAEDEITVVSPRGDEISVDLDDLDVDLLVESFNLSFRPTTLCFYDEKKNKRKVIPIKSIKKFTPGLKYHVQQVGGGTSGIAVTDLSDSAPPQPGPSRPLMDAAKGLLALRQQSPEQQQNSSPSKQAKRVSLWSSNSLKEVVQNAVIVSKAVYADTDHTCEKYLRENLEDHCLKSVARSLHGKCHFLVAEEMDRQSGGSNRLYVAFRGTASTEDWKDNMKAFQEEGSSVMKIIRGKFHSGFLSRAICFPANKILNDEEYKNRDIVVCGHSLGGAVATIVAVILMLEVERRRKAGADDQVSRDIV